MRQRIILALMMPLLALLCLCASCGSRISNNSTISSNTPSNSFDQSRHFKADWLSDSEFILQIDPGKSHSTLSTLKLEETNVLTKREIHLPKGAWIIAPIGDGKGVTIAAPSKNKSASRIGILRVHDFSIDWLPVRGQSPVSNPQGSSIAFLVLDELGLDLFVWDLEKSEERRMTSGQTIREFCWSPDGTKLGYISILHDSFGPFKYSQPWVIGGANADLAESQWMILTSPIQQRNLTWLDNEHLAFRSATPKPNALAVYSLPVNDKYLPQRIADIPISMSTSSMPIQWRKNFLFTETGPTQIVRTDVVTGNALSLSMSPLQNAQLSYWSPSLDGSKCIAILKGSQDLLLGDFTTGKVSKLTVLSE